MAGSFQLGKGGGGGGTALLPRGPTYPTRARPPQESQVRAPGWYEIRVTIIWLQAGQQICMGCSRKISGPGM